MRAIMRGVAVIVKSLFGSTASLNTFESTPKLVIVRVGFRPRGPTRIGMPSIGSAADGSWADASVT
jgi:hypothetical protein